MVKSPRLPLTLHPLFVATGPILFLAAVNVDQIGVGVLLLPLGLSLLGTLLVGVLWRLVVPEWERAALLTSTCMFFFLLHGRFYQAAELWVPLPARYLHLFLLGLWLLTIAMAWLYLRPQRELRRLHSPIFSVTGVFCLLSLAQLTVGSFRRVDSALAMQRLPCSPLDGRVEEAARGEPEGLPDIYYIVLDGYGREDRMRAVYGYDNSAFVDYLAQSGFYVVHRGRSNYALTSLSLASSLNMRYINEDADRIGAMISNNEVGACLQSMGYKFIHFNTAWGGTERSAIADVSYPANVLPEFHVVLLRTTMLQAIITFLRPIIDVLPYPTGAELHVYHFQKLKQISELQEPTFTFAHIVSPHPPYYFDAMGDIRRRFWADESWTDRDLYAGQMTFVNDQMKDVVDAILKQSSTPPIIVIQSDHGTAALYDERKQPRAQPAAILERMSILNAYYGPDSFRNSLYASISPVNTFRLLFNTQFGFSFAILQDRSFFSWYDRPDDLIDVTSLLDATERVPTSQSNGQEDSAQAR